MPTMYDRQGNPVDIPAADVVAAYQSGQYGLPQGAKVNVVDASGTSYNIDPTDLTALPEGWQVEDDAAARKRELESQYGTLEEQAKTGLEHFVSGATVGLIDPVLGEIGGEQYKRERASRAAANPTLAIGSEVAGAIAPALLSRGSTAEASLGNLARVAGSPARAVSAAGRVTEGLVGRGLTGLGVTGESIGGRALMTGAKYGAGGAVEGGLYGAGRALSEASLAPGGNYDHLSEKLLAGAKEGALFGGAVGGALGTAGGAVVGVGSKALSGPTGLKRMLSDFAEEQVGSSLGLSKGDIKKFGRSADAAENNVRKMLRDVLDGQLDDGTRIVNALDKAEDLADKVSRAREEIGAKLGALRKQNADAAFDAVAVQRKIMDEIVTPLEASGAASQAQRAAKVRGELPALKGNTLADANKFIDVVDDILYPAKRPGMQAPVPEHLRELERARMLVEESVEVALPAEQRALYKQLKDKYGSFADASKIAGGATLNDLTGRLFSTSDSLVGGLTAAATIASGGVGAVGGLLQGAAVSAAHKAVRERSGSVLAVLADRAAKTDSLVSKSVTNFLKGTSGTTRSTLETNPSLLRRKATGLAGAVRTTDQALARKKDESRTDAYARRIKEINDKAANPEQFVESRVGFAANEAPLTTASAAATLTRGVAFLKSKAPPPATGGAALLQPQLRKDQPDAATVAKFARYVQAVDKPLSVLEELEDGTLTKEHVEALREVYPALYQDIRVKVMDEVSTAKEPIPYNKRIQLGVLLDLPTDPSLEPQNMKLTQGIYAPQQEQAPEQQGGPTQPNATTDIAEDFETDAQAIAAGHEEF